MNKKYFGYNKRRKHYAYVYDSDGNLRNNLLLSTKPVVKITKKGKTRFVDNEELYKHPNPNYKPKNKNDKVYLVKRKYVDNKDNISVRPGWFFHEKDIPKVEKIITKK